MEMDELVTDIEQMTIDNMDELTNNFNKMVIVNRIIYNCPDLCSVEHRIQQEIQTGICAKPFEDSIVI